MTMDTNLVETHLRILFVEDERDDIELECRQLKRENFSFDWHAVTSEDELRRELSEYRPDLILCDYSIPGFSGREALHIAKEISPLTPFLFVSGTIGEDTAVACLQEGATDYLLKGSLRRLGAAVKRALTDVEARKRELDLEETRRRLVTILEATPDLVTVCDPGGRLTYINEAGCKLLGVTREEALAGTPDFHYPSWALDVLHKDALPHAIEHGTWVGETAIISHDGAEIPMSQVLVAHKDEQGKARYFSTIARDIRDRKAYEARILHLANYDALTGLPNRALLGDRVAQALILARHANRRMALITVNIDGFRTINNGFGHEAGDQVLMEVAARVKSSVHEGDTVARAGADEFVVLLPELARAEDAHAIARKIQDAICQPLRVCGRDRRVTASAGAAIYPEDGDEAETLLRNAGAAMLRAKSLERGSFQFCAPDLARECLERARIETELGTALRTGALTLHYQPLRSLKTGKICGTEALMRWLRPGVGMVPPATFIPIAEESGLIGAMGQWALGQACVAAREWLEKGCTLSVNISPRQMLDAGLPEAIRKILEQTQFPAERLELEVTESTLVSGHAEALESFEKLKALGVVLTIDDFGTGYSSLSYLSRLPIDRLKIDRSFVERMITDARDAAIVRSTINLGHGLGLEVTAEGVETQEQLAMLETMGCDLVQGYLISRPLTQQDFASLLEAS